MHKISGNTPSHTALVEVAQVRIYGHCQTSGQHERGGGLKGGPNGMVSGTPGYLNLTSQLHVNSDIVPCALNLGPPSFEKHTEQEVERTPCDTLVHVCTMCRVHECVE